MPNIISMNSGYLNPSESIPALPSLPSFALWESNMTLGAAAFKIELAASVAAEDWVTIQADTGYYDGINVYYRIYDYTNDSQWLAASRDCEIGYRDNYYRPNSGGSGQGFRIYPHGLYRDYISSTENEVATRTAAAELEALGQESAYAWVDTNSNWQFYFHSTRIREAAYNLQAQVYAEKAGQTRNVAKIERWLMILENHFWQHKYHSHLNSQSEAGVPNTLWMPYMTGLASHALIDFYGWEVENERDPDAYFPATQRVYYELISGSFTDSGGLTSDISGDTATTSGMGTYGGYTYLETSAHSGQFQSKDNNPSRTGDTITQAGSGATGTVLWAHGGNSADWTGIKSMLGNFWIWAFTEALVVAGTEIGEPMYSPNTGGTGATAWTVGTGDWPSFRYENEDDTPEGVEPQPPLNLLICPVFGWLAVQDNDTSWITNYGDPLFFGGVDSTDGGWLIDYYGKAFNQNYRWSFEYVEWRASL